MEPVAIIRMKSMVCDYTSVRREIKVYENLLTVPGSFTQVQLLPSTTLLSFTLGSRLQAAIFETRHFSGPLRHLRCWIGRKSALVLCDFGEARTGKDS
jgi:hypothetical protein